MRQFTVPQFIDVEDKVIAFITVRQFLILMATAVVLAIEYKLLFFTTWLVIGIIELIIACVVAFLPVNGRPFHYFILTIIQTLRKPKLRTWNQSGDDFGIFEGDMKNIGMSQEKVNVFAKKNPTASRLAELSLVVDTKGSYMGEKESRRSEVYSVGRDVEV